QLGHRAGAQVVALGLHAVVLDVAGGDDVAGAERFEMASIFVGLGGDEVEQREHTSDQPAELCVPGGAAWAHAAVDDRELHALLLGRPDEVGPDLTFGQDDEAGPNTPQRGLYCPGEVERPIDDSEI